MVALVWGYGSIRIGETDKAIEAANTAKISVVQGNIDQSLKWNQSFQLETLAKYGRLSYAASKEKPDLIVWPETAAPFYYTNDKYLTYKIKETFRNCGTEFLIGFPSYTSEMGSFKFFNSAYIMNPEGMIEGTYSKTHLVPFGEYVPLQDFLPFIHKLTEQSGDFYPGEKGNTLDFANGKIGTQICFEVIFPELSRAMVSNGAQLIANITNDAWFGKSSAPFQHFSMVKFRAVENKRAIARAANTGISGFIDPLGRELAASDLYVDAQLTRSLPLLNTLTFYTRFGDVFVWGLFLVFAPFAAVRIRQKGFRKRKTPEAPK
jgi:apolipoprotein N-acyltransferase